MKTRFFTLAALALALVACNNDNENLNGGPVAAQFTANIAPVDSICGMSLVVTIAEVCRGTASDISRKGVTIVALLLRY